MLPATVQTPAPDAESTENVTGLPEAPPVAVSVAAPADCAGGGGGEGDRLGGLPDGECPCRCRSVRIRRWTVSPEQLAESMV